MAADGTFLSTRKWARDIDREVRRVLKEHKLRYRIACVDRLYVHTRNGGLGLKSFEEVLLSGLIYTWCYIRCQKDLITSRILFKRLADRTKRTIEKDMLSVIEKFKLE